jgi:hypothetical protein
LVRDGADIAKGGDGGRKGQSRGRGRKKKGERVGGVEKNGDICCVK